MVTRNRLASPANSVTLLFCETLITFSTHFRILLFIYLCRNTLKMVDYYLLIVWLTTLLLNVSPSLGNLDIDELTNIHYGVDILDKPLILDEVSDGSTLMGFNSK